MEKEEYDVVANLENHHPEKEEKKEEGTWLMRVSKTLEIAIARGCAKLAAAVARWPHRTIGISLLVCVVCSLGWIRIEDEQLSEKLYTPQETRAFSDRDWIEDVFSDASAGSTVYLNAEDGVNLLSKPALLEAFDMYDLVMGLESEGQSRGYDTRSCATVYWYPDAALGPADDPRLRCQKTGILAFWDWNRTLLELDDDVLATVNRAYKTDCCSPNGRLVELTSNAARLDFDQYTGNATYAGALTMRFYLDISLNSKTREDPHARRLENKFDRRLRAAHWEHFDRPLPLTNYGFESNGSSAFDFDRIFINGAIIVIILYAFFALYDPYRPDRSRGVLGLGAVVCVIVSTVAGFGIAIALGVGFSPSTGVAIFLVLGIGLDDSFVICSAVDEALDEPWYDPALAPLENDARRVLDGAETLEDAAARRIEHTLRIAGPSITVTSITDAAAFIAGSFGSIPDIANFNKFAGIAVLVDFAAQLTFFVALFTLDQRRRLRAEVESRADRICSCRPPACLWVKSDSSKELSRTAPEDDDDVEGRAAAAAETNDAEREERQEVDADTESVASPDDKASSGCTPRMMFSSKKKKKTKTERRRDPPLEQRFWSEYYPRVLLSWPARVFVLATTAVIAALAAVGCARAVVDIDNSWIIVDWGPFRYVYTANKYGEDHFSSGTTTWVGLYTKRADYFENRDDMRQLIDAYADQNFVVASSLENNWFDEHWAWVEASNQTVATSDEYLDSLRLYLDTDGLSYRAKVHMDDRGVFATEIDTRWDYEDVTGNLMKRRMRKSRAEVRDNSGDLGTVVVYNNNFVWYESFQVIAQTTIFAMAVASAVVLTVLILLIGDILAATLVASLVALTCAATFGAAYWYKDYGINYITGFMIIIAVGLSADAPAHMMKAFLDRRDDTRAERATKALGQLGPAVFRGGVSTILGIALTGACITYVFRSFFRYLMTILVLSLWNGLAVMPVLCSLIGPMPQYKVFHA